MERLRILQAAPALLRRQLEEEAEQRIRAGRLPRQMAPLAWDLGGQLAWVLTGRLEVPWVGRQEGGRCTQQEAEHRPSWEHLAHP